MRIGVAYYPEHWPEERWPVDARMIKDMGIQLVRIGEFAWSRLEPKRGQYDMDWLDRAISALASEGLEVILCTPTAAPPAWLFHRHPSMCAQDEYGHRWNPGSRRAVCLNNRPYQRYVRRVLRELARRFARNPHIYAWQIDDGLDRHESRRCYCDDCEQAFREWLRRRYGTIERVNKLWGAVFWSQEFSDWHLVPAPRRTPAGPHPSLALDYQRFVSASVRDFVDEQRKLIEEYSSGRIVVTTNTGGLDADHLDLFSLAGPQDVSSLKNYPMAPTDVDSVALNLDLSRSIKSGPFWVMEQRAGTCRLPGARQQPQPGQLRLWSFQAASRGAEMINYFRWRSAPFAQETQYYGMLGPDGSETRHHCELRDTIAELRRTATYWAGRTPHAQVAIVLDYSAHWALLADDMGAGFDGFGQVRECYSALRRMGVAVDLVPPQQNPASYDLLIAPMAHISREQVAQQWRTYVGDGGILLATGSVGFRTDYNTASLPRPPGHFKDLLGVEIAEFDVLGEGAESVSVIWQDEPFPAWGFMALVETDLAEVAATWDDSLYGGEPAVTRNALGQGAAWLFAGMSDATFYSRLLGHLLKEAGIETSSWASETVEVIPLKTPKGKKRLTFVLNHGPMDVELKLPQGKKRIVDLLSDATYSTTVPLSGYGVVLLQG